MNKSTPIPPRTERSKHAPNLSADVAKARAVALRHRADAALWRARALAYEEARKPAHTAATALVTMLRGYVHAAALTGFARTLARLQPQLAHLSPDALARLVQKPMDSTMMMRAAFMFASDVFEATDEREFEAEIARWLGEFRPLPRETPSRQPPIQGDSDLVDFDDLDEVPDPFPL